MPGRGPHSRGGGLRLAAPCRSDGGMGADLGCRRLPLIPATPPRLIYVTPPRPSIRPAPAWRCDRRMALLDHARAHNAIILEDDYDSEFVWRGWRDRCPCRRLDDDERVIGFGTVAKEPGARALRIAWMVVPDALVEHLRRAQRQSRPPRPTSMARPPCRISWRAASIGAHLRKIHPAHYGQRARMPRRWLEEGGGARWTGCRSCGRMADCRFACRCPTPWKRLLWWRPWQARGFAVAGFSGYYLDHGRAGLVIGFAHANPASVAALCATLEGALPAS